MEHLSGDVPNPVDCRDGRRHDGEHRRQSGVGGNRGREVAGGGGCRRRRRGNRFGRGHPSCGAEGGSCGGHPLDFTGGDGSDGFGHGTHVGAQRAGRGGRPARGGRYRGIASGARVINLRVLRDDGSGMSSNVIEAIDWAIENRKASTASG